MLLKSYYFLIDMISFSLALESLTNVCCLSDDEDEDLCMRSLEIETSAMVESWEDVRLIVRKSLQLRTIGDIGEYESFFKGIDSVSQNQLERHLSCLTSQLWGKRSSLPNISHLEKRRNLLGYEKNLLIYVSITYLSICCTKRSFWGL